MQVEAAHANQKIFWKPAKGPLVNETGICYNIHLCVQDAAEMREKYDREEKRTDRHGTDGGMRLYVEYRRYLY